MHPMLNTAVKAARKAGAIITRASFDVDKLTIRSKQQNDFVSEVDHAAEDAVISVLKEAYPDHGFLGEESGYKDRDAEYLWIIDPLDGTTNFLHGVPQYCVSIGLMHKGQLTQGVVYDPNRNELFTATKGVGAYLNDRRIRVSKLDKLDGALVGTGFPFKVMDNVDDYLRMLKNVMKATSGVRRPGAAALDLAWVAAGRMDAFWEIGLSPWDMAAGALLVREAGGLMGDLEGEDKYMDSGRVLATNGKLFSAMLQLLKQRG
ncbi:MAG TPA: inositol monophosphatase family protein [Usitatibacter sp.]|nr:inositol monophosphatase family protein [Usitatibacter sp.]